MVLGGCFDDHRQGQLYHHKCVSRDMPEEKAPKIDFKALETITKKVLAHQPDKKPKSTVKLNHDADQELHVPPKSS